MFTTEEIIQKVDKFITSSYGLHSQIINGRIVTSMTNLSEVFFDIGHVDDPDPGTLNIPVKDLDQWLDVGFHFSPEIDGERESLKLYLTENVIRKGEPLILTVLFLNKL